MFSQTCVKNSVHRGREVYTPVGRHTPGRHPPWQTATAAGGTHPIGMHSCFKILF